MNFYELILFFRNISSVKYINIINQIKWWLSTLITPGQSSDHFYIVISHEICYRKSFVINELLEKHYFNEQRLISK